MAYLTVNGTPLPAPDEDDYQVSWMDLDSENSQRNEAGYMPFRDRIRGDMYQIDVGWTVDNAGLIVLKNALSATVLNTRFFDPTGSSDYVTKKLYPGNRVAKLVGGGMWKFTCTLTEM